MFCLRLESIKKMLQANGCEYRGTLSGGRQEVVLFRYCGYDMGMRAGEMTEKSIRQHIEQKITAFIKPMVDGQFQDSLTDQILQALERMMA